jgi:LysR family transcriptional regulator, transcriptional activator of nhaA
MTGGLNYHHLLYFWTVAREGGLGPAARALHLSPSTLSGQIHQLEDSVGEKLFERVGRRLTLTEMGATVFRYAEEIFALGRELQATLRSGRTQRPARLRIGVVDSLPKMIVRRLVEPVLHLREPIVVSCYEDRFDRLLSDLGRHDLDLVLADAPVPPGSAVRAFAHPLGTCDLEVFGVARFAGLARGFPGTLQEAPMLLPLSGLPLRRALDAWFDARGIRPRVVGEFEDSALMKAFGAEGAGVFAAPSAVAKQVKKQYGVRSIGRIAEIHETFYAVSVERKLKHPAVVAISQGAHEDVFVRRTPDG